MSDYHIGVDQKFSDCLIKTMFLGQAETAVMSGIESRFAIISCSTSDAILGLWVFFFFSLSL